MRAHSAAPVSGITGSGKINKGNDRTIPLPAADPKPFQVDEVSHKGGRGKKSPLREKIKVAAKHFGMSESEVRRALKVASLSPEAKSAAVLLGMNNNRSALLRAANRSTPEEQVEELRQIAAGRKAATRRRTCCPHCGGTL